MEPENKEFVRLMKAAGWSQNETARRLQMTGGGVSQICTGKVRPSKGRLNLLRLLVEREKPGALKQREMEGWARDLLGDLRQMPEGQRSALLGAIRQMLKAIGRQRAAGSHKR